MENRRVCSPCPPSAHRHAAASKRRAGSTRRASSAAARCSCAGSARTRSTTASESSSADGVMDRADRRAGAAHHAPRGRPEGRSALGAAAQRRARVVREQPPARRPPRATPSDGDGRLLGPCGPGADPAPSRGPRAALARKTAPPLSVLAPRARGAFRRPPRLWCAGGRGALRARCPRAGSPRTARPRADP